MSNCLSKLLSFCSGEVDINQNSIPDNQELLSLLKILLERLEKLDSAEQQQT